jgi:hypothetical protein
MDFCMNTQPDFSSMTSRELLTYVLDHREDQEALYAYLDKRHSENPNPREYEPDEDVSVAIAEHLRAQQLKDNG